MTSTALKITRASEPKPLFIWLTGVSFVLFQFALQLSSGVIIGNIMEEMQLNAFATGLLGSSFYIIYTALQIPAGLLFDRTKAHLILSSTALICSLGCLIFASSSSLAGLFVGRMLIGAGSAFAFVGLSHLIRQHFPVKRFAFMIGVSETFGFLATTTSIIGMGPFINHWGWRAVHMIAAGISLIIAFFCWRMIPDGKANVRKNMSFQAQLWSVLRTGKLWLNGLFAGLGFAVVTVFGALWSVPFTQELLQCDTQHAGFVSAFFFIGTAMSCIVFGVLPNHVKSRRLLTQGSCLTTAFALIALIFTPHPSTLSAIVLMFITGLCCGGYLLAYSISNELAHRQTLSTATGFTNTLAVLIAPLMQPTIGFILDLNTVNQNYTVHHYQQALSIIPLGLLFAAVICFFLPEKA